MTTHYSPQAKAFSPCRESDVGNLHCVIGYLPATHGLTLAQNDIIQMVHVPLGATVIDVILETGALGTSVTADVGDGNTENLYISANDHSSAAISFREYTSAVGVPYTYTEQDTIDVKLEGGDPADDKAIRLDVMYVVGVDTTP